MICSDNEGYDESFGHDLSEDLEELRLLDLSVSTLVNGLDELVDLFLGWLLPTELSGSSTDEVVGLIGIKGVAVVLVELSEDGINGFSELLVGISHFDFQYITNISSIRAAFIIGISFRLNYTFQNSVLFNIKHYQTRISTLHFQQKHSDVNMRIFFQFIIYQSKTVISKL